MVRCLSWPWSSRFGPSATTSPVAGPLEQLVAPPYDVIGEAQREELMARSPFNVVHLTLPDEEADAARLWREWLSDGALVRDQEPSFWALEQEYVGPDGVERTTRAGSSRRFAWSRTRTGSSCRMSARMPGRRRGGCACSRRIQAHPEPIFLLYDGAPPFEHPAGEAGHGGRGRQAVAPSAGGNRRGLRRQAAADRGRPPPLRDGDCLRRGAHPRRPRVDRGSGPDDLPDAPGRGADQRDDPDTGSRSRPWPNSDEKSPDRAAAVVYRKGGAAAGRGRRRRHSTSSSWNRSRRDRHLHAAPSTRRSPRSSAGTPRAPSSSGPTRIEDVFRFAEAGETLPQKTTYFYPKLLVGPSVPAARVTPWLEVCRGAAADVREALAELPTRVEREPVLATGVGGDDTTASTMRPSGAGRRAARGAARRARSSRSSPRSSASEPSARPRPGSSWIRSTAPSTRSAACGTSASRSRSPRERRWATSSSASSTTSATGEEWTADTGQGAQLTASRSAASRRRTRSRSSAMEGTLAAPSRDHASPLTGFAQRLRITGSLALSLCQLAAGRVDACCSLGRRARSTSPRAAPRHGGRPRDRLRGRGTVGGVTARPRGPLAGRGRSHGRVERPPRGDPGYVSEASHRLLGLELRRTGASFYPKGLPASRWLEHYAELFDTVEVNTTFYRLPTGRPWRGWVEQTPAGLRLRREGEPLPDAHQAADRTSSSGVERFYERIEPLVESPKLGPVLWQLPPNFKRDDDRLAARSTRLPPGRHCFEFRHRELVRRRGLRAAARARRRARDRRQPEVARSRRSS